MKWEALILIGFLVAGALLTVADVGKPRKPLDNRVAVGTLIATGLMVWLLIRLGAS